LIVGLAGVAVCNAASPIEKIIQMISDLETKVIGEGKAAQKTYDEYAEWCEESSKNLQFEIKTGKSDVASLKATIDDDAANIAAQDSKIEELAGEIASDEADLKAATEIRAKEAASFSAKETDLVETVDILERAIGIIEKEMNGGAALAQIQQASSVVDALSAMVRAQSISSADGAKLTALVQASDSDDDAGAPAADVYQNQSGGILDTMNDILGKAQDELEKARTEEQDNINNFEMLKQSLTDEIAFANKEMKEAKASKAKSSESKAAAEGDLDVTSKDLAQDVDDLGNLHHECLTTANDFEAETADRGEELKALATAKKIIKETTGGAAGQSYSFLQSSIASSSDLRNFEAVRFVKQLAKKHGSNALAQLASRMASAIRFGGSNKDDIFAKVKGLISDMVAKLEAEAEADATEKAFCDKELAETNAKKDDKTAEIEKLTADIDQKTARAAQLRDEIATLQAELAELTKSQAEMDKIRAEEHAEWEVNSKEMEQGLNGVKLALKVLNEYYQKSGKAGGASSGIIGLLEVCESDFSKALTEMNAAEDTSQSEYDQQSKENEITKVTKEQDVKYKTKEAAGLDQAVAELSSDKGAVETELAAVNEYLKELNARCVAKAETYSERKQRREDEINGLKEALTILENETAFLQKSTHRLRATRRH